MHLMDSVNMNSDQFQMGKGKVFVKNPESVGVDVQLESFSVCHRFTMLMAVSQLHVVCICLLVWQNMIYIYMVYIYIYGNMTLIHFGNIMLTHFCNMILIHFCNMILIHFCNMILMHFGIMMLMQFCNMLLIHFGNMMLMQFWKYINDIYIYSGSGTLNGFSGCSVPAFLS